MELRELAERVLFAASLDEKLSCPENITDEHPGAPLIAPAAPGRPAQLQFKPHGSGKSDFPGLHRLEDERERGRLLHFFGNHELLATELMALVLLRFPGAPAAFRKGVLQTLRDEQEHTRLYIERMKSCGIEFGEFPVSGYFWRCVAPMENPIDYVASLCLTFEQANLDFARHFARGFSTVGDANTAALLEKIYRDEIGHVAYGLKWFRRWKNPGESDWEAFCHALKFPLSPQRAKGFSVNVEGRRAAGLDPQFIAQLNVYSQSKGRTPNVFVFNPFAEGFIAEGAAFNPTKQQAQLARDLENLPQFLCRQDDIVLVESRPRIEFLSEIKSAGFALPEFVEMGSGRNESASSKSPPGAAATRQIRERLSGRKLGALRPWAWGPDSLEVLRPLFGQITAEERGERERFNEGLAELYSKAWSAEFLRRILDHNKSESWLCRKEDVCMAVNTLDEALAVIRKIRETGHHKIVVKEAFGLAGSNAMRLFEPELLEAHRRWMANAFEKRRRLVIEPWLDRVVDFSVQLEMTPRGLKLCGFTGLHTDASGRFLGNWAESHHHTRIPAKVISAFREPKDISRRLLDFYSELFARLEEELRRVNFIGPIGIDAFAYRDRAGTIRLKPVVEINPRYTMGRVTVELMKQTRPGTAGELRLIQRAAIRRGGISDFAGYAQALKAEFPLRLEGEPVARIAGGIVFLNDPAQAETCLATFRVTTGENPV